MHYMLLCCKLHPYSAHSSLHVYTSVAPDVILQHPVALHRSDFTFCFYAVCVQHRLLFTRRLLFKDTTCLGLTRDLQVFRLL
jgi:hypothetical protein